MEYQKFVNDVENLGFIKDPDTADAAIKAVLGILASSMEEPQARKLTEKLPEPLTYDRLVGHQARLLDISIDEYVAEIGTQFGLNDDEARELVDTIFHNTKKAVGEDTLTELEYDMPSEIAEEFENA
ncbi:MAG: DUF2267 domain-containing protein [Deltaproteobacteria bacterium]|nr:DUF2267 domain-containing protein [Deltaproteobacteria bacterium]